MTEGKQPKDRDAGIKRYFDYHLDVENRNIYIGSDDDDELTAEIAEMAIKSFTILNSVSKDPITVTMNSPGGDYYHGMAVYDAIRNSPCRVTITAYGYCMSMGSIIFQAADIRIMAPHAIMMIHDGQESFWGTPKELVAYADHSKKVEQTVHKIYLERTGMLKKEFLEMYRNTKYFTAQEAVKYGFADKVMVKRKLPKAERRSSKKSGK